MSVSIDEVLGGAGYDVLNDIDDARWLLGNVSDFKELVEKAEEFVEKFDEYDVFCDTLCDIEGSVLPTFDEWLEEQDER